MLVAVPPATLSPPGRRRKQSLTRLEEQLPSAQERQAVAKDPRLLQARAQCSEKSPLPERDGRPRAESRHAWLLACSPALRRGAARAPPRGAAAVAALRAARCGRGRRPRVGGRRRQPPRRRLRVSRRPSDRDEAPPPPAQQLLRFVALGLSSTTRGQRGRVPRTRDPEAVAFQNGSRAAISDLRTLPSATPRAAAGAAYSRGSGRRERPPARRRRRPAERRGPSRAASRRPHCADDQVLDRASDASTTTDRRTRSPQGRPRRCRRYRPAGRLRLEATRSRVGPERRLQAFDSGLALDVEGLIWFAAGPGPGSRADRRARAAPRGAPPRTARLARSWRLGGTLVDSASRATVVTNARIIVFLEASGVSSSPHHASFVGAPVARFRCGRRRLAWWRRRSRGRSRIRCCAADSTAEARGVVGLSRRRVLLITNCLNRVYWSRDRQVPRRRRRGEDRRRGLTGF